MDTIGDLKRRKLWLSVSCYCGRHTLIPYRLLPRRLVDDLPVCLAAAYFRCGACDGKQLQSTMADALAHGKGQSRALPNGR